MERKKLLYWIIQFVGWTAYFMFSVLLLFFAGDFFPSFNLYIYAGLSILASIAISHAIRFFIIRKSLLSKTIGQLIVITLFMSIIAAFILEFFQYFIEATIVVDYITNPHIDYSTFMWGDFLFSVSRSIILFLLWCGFYYVFAIIEKSRVQEISNLKWEASKNEIELKNLRAQLNPHFLFNSLNSIRALVGLNPEQAKISITQLSNLLRKSINLGKLKVIPLKEELDLVKTYLELEQVRFEERLRTEFDVQENSLELEIPPLMIQTIVENGIKHGISKAIDGGKVSVRTIYENKILSIEVLNSGKLEKGDEIQGIGISNSKKRLNILYGDKASFEIRQVKENVLVTININYS